MSGCLSLPVAAWVQWLPVVACGCLGCGCLSLPVAAWVKWLLVVACVKWLLVVAWVVEWLNIRYQILEARY